MLASLTSKQIADWLAYATMETIGPPIPRDPEAEAAAKRKAQRAKVEGGLRALKLKREAK